MGPMCFLLALALGLALGLLVVETAVIYLLLGGAWGPASAAELANAIRAIGDAVGHQVDLASDEYLETVNKTLGR